MVDIKTGVIEFDLDNPIEVSKDGDIVECSEVKYLQPKRKHAATFENLANLYKSSLIRSMLEMSTNLNEDQKEDAKEKAESKKPENKKLENITLESIEQEVQDAIEQLDYVKFDYEQAYKLFNKLILNNNIQNHICFIGDIPITEVLLDKVNFRDYKRMMIMYICFFARSVKSGTEKGLGERPGSHTPAKAL